MKSFQYSTWHWVTTRPSVTASKRQGSEQPSHNFSTTAIPATMVMEETLVPLNDSGFKKLSKNTSFGSEKEIEALNLKHDGEEDTLEYRIHAENGKKNCAQTRDRERSPRRPSAVT